MKVFTAGPKGCVKWAAAAVEAGSRDRNPSIIMKAHLHLELPGHMAELYGNSALQSVPHQQHTLTALVGHPEDLPLYGLQVHTWHLWKVEA